MHCNPYPKCYDHISDDKGWFIGAGAGAIPGLAFFRRMANKTPPKPILGGVVGATTIMLGSWLGGGYTNTFGTQEKIKTAIQNGEWERKFPEGLVHKQLTRVSMTLGCKHIFFNQNKAHSNILCYQASLELFPIEHSTKFYLHKEEFN